MKATEANCGALIQDIDPDLLSRADAWYDQIIEHEPKLSAHTFVLLELMQKVS